MKTAKSRRIIKLNSKALDALPRHRDGKYIFKGKNDKPLWPRHIQNTLDSILKRAGIPHKSTHVFRHTFASMLFEQGEDVKVVSSILGHASVAITYNTYITLIERQTTKAMEAIEVAY